MTPENGLTKPKERCLVKKEFPGRYATADWSWGEVWLGKNPIPCREEEDVRLCKHCGMRLNKYNFGHYCHPYKHDLTMAFYEFRAEVMEKYKDKKDRKGEEI
jgi:hypothetical protein